MGQCTTSDAAHQRSRMLDEQLRKHKRYISSQAKILLLGPGESGKTTLFKQMKIIQDGGGFTEEELLSYKHVVHANCFSQMKLLIQGAIKTRQSFEHQDNIALAQHLMNMPAGNNIWNAQIGQSIKSIWADSGIQALYTMAGKNFQLNDTANYFFDNIDRFMKEDYIPTIEDVLRVRVRSTGIEEAEFTFDKVIFRVVDVGGQRSERRKWIHCFDSVTAILFCASLSCYDQMLREDISVNAMMETLNLFEDVTSSYYFQGSCFILFLNKTDLFQDKLIKSDLKETFPNYEGGQDYEKGIKFIEARFRERVPNGVVPYIHATCALNTQQIETIINDVKKKLLDILLKNIADF